jgi:hypothetical protein
MPIVNLTQHPATQEQKDAGVRDVASENQSKLRQLLTFDTLPTVQDLRGRASQLFQLFEEETLNDNWETTQDQWPSVMIGGAPYLMSHLEECFLPLGISVLYAFSQRRSVEEQQADGSVVKRTVFVHEGFVSNDPS